MAFRGSGWAALGAGLSNLGALAEKSQAEARKEQLDNAERDLRLRTLKAQEMAQPGAMSLEAALPALNQRALTPVPGNVGVHNPVLGDMNVPTPSGGTPDFRNDPSALTPESLARIGNADDATAEINFRPPAPISKTVNGQQITLRDSAPFLTGTGVVEDPRGAREQAMAASDLAYATTNERAQAEADRQGDLLEKAGVPKDRVAAIRARIPASAVDDLFRQDSRGLAERMPVSIQMLGNQIDDMRQRLATHKQGIKTPDVLQAKVPGVMDEYNRQLALTKQYEDELSAKIDERSNAISEWMAANPRGGVTPKPNAPPGLPTSPVTKPYVYAGPVGSYAMPPDLTGGQDINTSLPQPALGNISAMANRGKVAPPSTPTPTLAPPLAGMAPPVTPPAPSSPAPAAPVPPPASAPPAAPASVTTPTATLNTSDPATARATAQKLQAQGKTPAEIMQIMNAAGFRIKHRGQP